MLLKVSISVSLVIGTLEIANIVLTPFFNYLKTFLRRLNDMSKVKRDNFVATNLSDTEYKMFLAVVEYNKESKSSALRDCIRKTYKLLFGGKNDDK